MSGSADRRLVDGAGSAEESATQTVDDRGTETASAWTPVDLTAVLTAGIEPVAPDYLMRGDGALLLYAGKLNVIFAAPEAGKTWIAIFAIAQRVENAVKRGGAVVAVFIDYEDDATTFLSRLAAAGIDPTDAIRHTRYYSVAQSIGSAPHDLEGLDTAEIVVIDTTNSAMTLDGLDPLSNANALTFINDVRRLRGATRAAWLLLDHEPISTGPGRRQALGAQSKLGAVDGAQYRAVAVEQPRPGGRGVIDLYVTKDRPGAVRSVSGPLKDGIQHAARITTNPLGSSSKGFEWAILEPGGGQGDTELRAKILNVVDGTGFSKNQIRKRVRATGMKRRNDVIDETVDALATEGRLEAFRKGNHVAYRVSETSPEAGASTPAETSPQVGAIPQPGDPGNVDTATTTTSPEKVRASGADTPRPSPHPIVGRGRATDVCQLCGEPATPGMIGGIKYCEKHPTKRRQQSEAILQELTHH